MKLRIATPLILLTALGLFGCPDIALPGAASITPPRVMPVAGQGTLQSESFSLRVTVSGAGHYRSLDR